MNHNCVINKEIMKTKPYIALILVILSLNSFAQNKNKYFKADSATLMQWHGGASWAPSGTTYEFYLTFKKNCTVRFDSVWIPYEKSLPVTLITTSGWKAADSVFKKDSSYIITVQRINPGSIYYEYKKDIMENGSAAPFEFKGMAMIRYYVNNKKHYFTIVENFKNVPCPPYP